MTSKHASSKKGLSPISIRKMFPPKPSRSLALFLTYSICRLVLQRLPNFVAIFWVAFRSHNKTSWNLACHAKGARALRKCGAIWWQLGPKNKLQPNDFTTNISETEPPRKFNSPSKIYVLRGMSTKSNVQPAEKNVIKNAKHPKTCCNIKCWKQTPGGPTFILRNLAGRFSFLDFFEVGWCCRSCVSSQKRCLWTTTEG